MIASDRRRRPAGRTARRLMPAEATVTRAPGRAHNGPSSVAPVRRPRPGPSTARAWTSTTHPKKPPGATSAARGSKRTPRRSSGSRRRHGIDVRDRRRRLPRHARKRWQAMKFDAGFARITWEPEFGGRNGTTMQQIIFGQEEARFAVPTEVFVIGLGMIAPTLRAVRHRRAEAALPHQAAARRGDLEPAVQRTGRGLRRRVALDRPRCATATSG